MSNNGKLHLQTFISCTSLIITVLGFSTTVLALYWNYKEQGMRTIFNAWTILNDANVIITNQCDTEEARSSDRSTVVKLALERLHEVEKSNGSWNPFNPYRGMNFVLDGLDVQGSHLANIDLSHASLRESNFKNAMLDSANFERVDLTGANFQNACLQNVSFAHASLSGADFTNAFLKGVDLSNTEIEPRSAEKGSIPFWGDSATFSEANLSYASFQGAYFGENTDLQYFVSTHLHGAILCKTIMPDGSEENRGCPSSQPSSVKDSHE